MKHRICYNNPRHDSQNDQDDQNTKTQTSEKNFFFFSPFQLRSLLSCSLMHAFCLFVKQSLFIESLSSYHRKWAFYILAKVIYFCSNQCARHISGILPQSLFYYIRSLLLLRTDMTQWVQKERSVGNANRSLFY